VIVLIIQNVCIAVLELESKPPVAIDPYGPTAPLGAFEGVKPKSWNSHVFDGLSCIQGSELHAKPLGMMRLDACGISRLEESLQTLVPK